MTSAVALTASAPDLAIAQAFVAALTGSAAHVVRLRFIHDADPRANATTEREGKLTDLWPAVLDRQANGYGVFYFLNDVSPGEGTGHGGSATDKDVTNVRVLGADFDTRLLDEWEFHASPDLIVRTSIKDGVQRGQVLWRVSDCALADFKPVQRRLAAYYATDLSACNLSRVFRLPGTLHLKREPSLVTFTSHGAAQTSLAILLEGIPELPNEPKAGGEGDQPATTERPVSRTHLRELLQHVDAGTDRGPWRDAIAAIRATPVVDDADGEQGLEIAKEWSATWSGWNDDAEAELEKIWRTMPPKADGVGYGTLLHRAREGGYAGSRAHEPASVAFADYLKSADLTSLAAANDEGMPRPTKFADVLTRVVPPVTELIAGLVEKGTVTFLSAPGGAHKSRVAVQWGLSLDAGLPVFGRTVEQASFVYVSYEDHADEVARRSQAISKRLGLPHNSGGEFWDLAGKDCPLASVSEGSGVELRPFWHRFVDHLRSTPGHKFVVLDSCYNALRFEGAAKINEGSVLAGIGLLQRLCNEANCTVLVLWHPSQAGQERGDASGWSVAWHNAPRARLSLSPVKDTEDAFELRVEKRNHGAKGKPLTLFWSDGVLQPRDALDSLEQGSRLMDVVVRVAIAAAEQSTPIQQQRRLHTWMTREIETVVGRRPPEREIKSILNDAVRQGRLRYVGSTNHRTAGFYPPDLQEAEALAVQAKRATENAGAGK